MFALNALDALDALSTGVGRSLTAQILALNPAAWHEIHPSRCYQDAEGTAPAAVGDPVMRVEDRSGNAHHAIAPTSAARPILRQDASGKYYLEFDGVDDALSVTLPDHQPIAHWISGNQHGTQISKAPYFGQEVSFPSLLRSRSSLIIPSALTQRQRTTVLRYMTKQGCGPEYAFVGMTNDTTIYHRIDSANGPYEITFIGANGAEYRTTANVVTTDVGAQGLIAPITMLVPVAALSDAALTHWNCYANQLTGLIPDLSANTALTHWYCSYNQLTGSIPDLSANTALGAWDCSINQLTGPIPDLSANTALTHWYCSYNQLTGPIPDLSANTALAHWYCRSNQLTGPIPDLSANTALTRWYCHNNQLTGSIPDLSANTALTHWYCYNNQLTGWEGGTIPASLTDARFYNNALNQAAVDGLLQAFDAAGASGGTLKLEGGTNAAPSATGLAAKANLEARGWTVAVNS